MEYIFHHPSPSAETDKPKCFGARDALLAKASIDLAMGRHAALGVACTGQLAGKVADHAAKGKCSWKSLPNPDQDGDPQNKPDSATTIAQRWFFDVGWTAPVPARKSQNGRHRGIASGHVSGRSRLNCLPTLLC